MAEVGAATVGEKVLEVEHVEPVVKHESHVQCHKSPEVMANKEKVDDLTKENNNTARCNLDKMEAGDEKGQKQDACKTNDISVQPKIKDTAKEKGIETNAVEDHIVGAETKAAQQKEAAIKDNDTAAERSHNKSASNNVDTVANKNTATAGKAQPNSKLYDGKNFVEAPIPKTNPWAKKTAAPPSATSSGTTSGAKACTAAPSSHKEHVGASDGSTKSKPDDMANAPTVKTEIVAKANSSSVESDNKSAEVSNVDSTANSTKPVQSADSTVKESSRGWWGTGSTGATNVPAPAKKIPQKAEEEKPAASGNSHASLPKTASPKIDSKTKVDAAKTKANPANVQNEKRSPVRNADGGRRQSGKSESHSGHSPVKSSMPRNRGDSTSSATADVSVGSGPERKERAEKVNKPEGVESAPKSSAEATTKSGEGETSKEVQSKTDEKRKSKWSDTPTPTKDDSQTKGVQQERTSRENEQKPGRKNTGRNRGSRSQGQDFNDSADWPKLKKGATGLSESEGPTPGAVPTSTDDKAIEGAVSSRAESASEGSSSGKSPTDSAVGNHIQPSEESGGDDSSVKDKSRGARKKGIKWKHMPIDLPKTERRRTTKPHNPDGGETRDADTRGGDRGGDRRPPRGGDREFRGGDREFRGGDKEYRGGDREFRGDRGDDREPRGGDRGEVRGGDRDTRGGDRDARGGDRDGRGGGSNRDRNSVARVDRGERSNTGAIRRKDTAAARVRGEKTTGAAEGNDAEPAPRWNPPSRSDAKNWHDAPSDPDAGVIGSGYSRGGGRGGYRGNRRAPPQGAGSRRGIGLGNEFILPGAHIGAYRQHFDTNPHQTQWLNCQYYTIPTAAQVPQAGIHYFDAPIVDVVPPPSPAVVFCDPDAVEKFLKGQIEYYFSEANLEHDFFLRRKMNKDGWIPVELIGHFKRVMIHGANTKQIIQAMKESDVVETSTDELLMRCKHNPTKWTVDGIDPTQFSSLKPNAVEFVPRQQFVAGQPYVPPGATHVSVAPSAAAADKPSAGLLAAATSPSAPTAAAVTADDKAAVISKTAADDRIGSTPPSDTPATAPGGTAEQRLLSDPSLTSTNQSINETSSSQTRRDEITRLDDDTNQDTSSSVIIVDTSALSDPTATSFSAPNPPIEVGKTSEEGQAANVAGEKKVGEESTISTEKLAEQVSGEPGVGGEVESPALH